jgi:drug/metabolite transporter (DMT)-like permease
LKKEIPSEALDLRAVPLILVMGLFWGGNSPAMKIALRDMDPFILAALRFTIGAIGVWLWAWQRRIDVSLRRNEFFPLAILGMAFAAQIATFNSGIHLSLATRATLLINTHPFFVALLAHFFISTDRLSTRKVLGLLVAFSGVFAIFRENLISGGESYITGDVILVVSACILAFEAVYIKRMVQGMNPVKLLTWQMTFSLVPLYAMAFIFENPSHWRMTSTTGVVLLYQGLAVGTFCFLVWTSLLKRYSASKVSAFLFVVPIFGVSLSYIMLGEQITFWLGVGTALVAIGIYIVNSCRTC